MALNTQERPQEKATAVYEEIMAQSLLKLIKDTNPDLNSAKPKQNENTKKITSKHIIKLFKLQRKKIKKKPIELDLKDSLECTDFTWIFIQTNLKNQF